jgi:phage major head subunit gpT-like protein
MATIVGTGLSEFGLRSEFFKQFDGTKTYFGDWATRVPSSAPKENYKWLGSIPKMREFGTGRLIRGVRVESYELENQKYEATLEIDRDEVSDDQTGQIMIRVRELAQLGATHKDFLISELIKNGASAGFLAYDGQLFFDTDHESGTSGQQSNAVTSDVTTTTDPTVDEFKKSIKQAIAKMLAFKNDVGDPVALDSTGLVIVTPPATYFTALEAVGATVIGNTTNILQGVAQVVSFPWLTDATKWYLLKTNAVIRPFVFQDREPVEFKFLGPESEESFKREKYLAGVRARYALGYGEWRFAVQTTFV